MKTIEEMSRDYQRSDEDDGTTATAFQNGAEWMREQLIAHYEAEISAYKKAVKEGLQRENIAQGIIIEKRKEITRLTKWHDPKEELPEYYKAVEIKHCGSGQTTISTAWLSAGDAGGYLWTIDGTNVLVNAKHVVGWREIHE